MNGVSISSSFQCLDTVDGKIRVTCESSSIMTNVFVVGGAPSPTSSNCTEEYQCACDTVENLILL